LEEKMTTNTINIVIVKQNEITEIPFIGNRTQAPEGKAWAQPIINSIAEALNAINQTQHSKIGSAPINCYFAKLGGDIVIAPELQTPKAVSEFFLTPSPDKQASKPVIVLSSSLFNPEKMNQKVITNRIAHGLAKTLDYSHDEIKAPSENYTKLHSISPLFQLALTLDVMKACKAGSDYATGMLPDITGDEKDAVLYHSFAARAATKLAGENNQFSQDVFAPFVLPLTDAYMESPLLIDASFRNKIIPRQPIDQKYKEFGAAIADPYAGLNAERFGEIQKMITQFKIFHEDKPDIVSDDQLEQAKSDVMNVINGLKAKYINASKGKGI
jgi:hypothetical protein